MANTFGKPFRNFPNVLNTYPAANISQFRIEFNLCVFQERVEAILIEDRVLSKRIFDLREAAASLAGGQVSQGGGVEMFQLSQELEVLINRQRALVQEKDEHERHIK